MISFPVYPPSSTSSRQYVLYLRVLVYSLSYMGNLFRLFNITQTQDYDRVASYILQLFVYFPKSDVRIASFLMMIERATDVFTERRGGVLFRAVRAAHFSSPSLLPAEQRDSL